MPHSGEAHMLTCINGNGMHVEARSTKKAGHGLPIDSNVHFFGLDGNCMFLTSFGGDPSLLELVLEQIG